MVAVVMLLSYHHAFKNDYDYVPYVSMYMQNKYFGILACTYVRILSLTVLYAR